MKIMLVYQHDTAHLFSVSKFAVQKARRQVVGLLMSGGYTEAIKAASDRLHWGIGVKTAHCDIEGDILDLDWRWGVGKRPQEGRVVVSSRLHQLDRDLQCISHEDWIERLYKLNHPATWTPGWERWHGKQTVVAEPEAAPVPKQFVDYRKYLRSPEWNSKRKVALREAGYRCQICNAGNCVLDVHHRTYERLGHELPTDLCVLCESCHDIFHAHGKLAKPK